MDDAQHNYSADSHSSAPNSARRGSWTPRIILWTLACVLGLWLGTGTHTVTAGGQKNKPSAAAQSALADVFRFDILLAGKESAVKPVRPKPALEAKCNLPAAFLAAMQQRPEPVYSVMPKTLSNTRPRFMFAPPSRPAGPWRVQLDTANMARLEQTQKQLQATLEIVPGMSAADRKSIQIEVDNACARIDSLRREQLLVAPDFPGPTVDYIPADMPDAWPARGIQLMP